MVGFAASALHFYLYYFYELPADLGSETNGLWKVHDFRTSPKVKALGLFRQVLSIRRFE